MLQVGLLAMIPSSMMAPLSSQFVASKVMTQVCSTSSDLLTYQEEL